MQKAQSNIQTGLDQLDEVVDKRTRAIQPTLKGVESLTNEDAQVILLETKEEEESET
jgi:DNA recombination protein RmuC